MIVTRIVEHRRPRGAGGAGAPARAPRRFVERARRSSPAPAGCPAPAAPAPAPADHPLLMTDRPHLRLHGHDRPPCLDRRTRTECRAFLEHFDATLSRFRPDSELCRLNADPREEVPASALLRAAISAGLLRRRAHRRPGRPDARRAARGQRLRPHPPRARARARTGPRRARPRDDPPRPTPTSRGGSVVLTDDCVRRPPGLRLRHGRNRQGPRRRRARAPARRPLGDRLRRRPARRRRPRRRGPPPAHRRPASTRLHITDGAVATSGIDTRLWRAPDGTPRHHLLDPSTGAPAWTGLISVTALAPTALEAEALAKAALPQRPAQARPAGSNATAGLVHRRRRRPTSRHEPAGTHLVAAQPLRRRRRARAGRRRDADRPDARRRPRRPAAAPQARSSTYPRAGRATPGSPRSACTA